MAQRRLGDHDFFTEIIKKNLGKDIVVRLKRTKGKIWTPPRRKVRDRRQMSSISVRKKEKNSLRVSQKAVPVTDANPVTQGNLKVETLPQV